MIPYDVIVIGAGGVGSAALFHLARRGVRVVGIDQFAPPHQRGSSHGQTRVIRQAYFEHPDYVPLVREAYELWAELEQLSGRQLFHQCGLIQAGPPDGRVISGVLRSATEHGLEVEKLDAAQLRSQCPALLVPDCLATLYERRAGFLLVEQCVQSHLEQALGYGAQLQGGATVIDWQCRNAEVMVHTTEGDFVGKKLVVAQGAWSLPLLASCGVRATVRRKSLFWFRCDDSSFNAESGLPVFLFELPKGVFYGFPKLDLRGVKVAEHSGGQDVDHPVELDRSRQASEERVLIEFISECLPGVSHDVTDHTVCMYTMTPDEHFIVDRHPQWDNVAFAAGLSGHGFKFAPVLGRALADLALDGSTTAALRFLSLDRFDATAV